MSSLIVRRILPRRRLRLVRAAKRGSGARDQRFASATATGFGPSSASAFWPMRYPSSITLLAFSCFLSSIPISAQTSSAARRHGQPLSQSPMVVAQAVVEPVPLLVAPPPIQQYKPATPPPVTWDGKQLSVKADSTLTDILRAVRVLTQ